jgi:hypothetical protein
MYDLKKLKPIYLDDLVRVGSKEDGGYVLSTRQIKQTEILLSFGIEKNWSFEEDFKKKSNEKVELYAFDHSVSSKIFATESRKYLASALGYLLMGNVKKAYLYGGYWRSLKHILKKFKLFFKEDSCHFTSKFVGCRDDAVFTRLDTILGNLSVKDNSLSIFIKMDIEGWEYKTLSQLTPFFLNKINGLVVEFHDLFVAEKIFEETIEFLSESFYIAHVHANNHGGLIQDTVLPEVLEITFINKALFKMQEGYPAYSARKYPLQGLDFPNNKMLDDIALLF